MEIHEYFGGKILEFCLLFIQIILLLCAAAELQLAVKILRSLLAELYRISTRGSKLKASLF